VPAYRQFGFFYSEEDFLRNTFELEDFFDADTVAVITDASRQVITIFIAKQSFSFVNNSSQSILY
jgi:hypothetical protein